MQLDNDHLIVTVSVLWLYLSLPLTRVSTLYVYAAVFYLHVCIGYGSVKTEPKKFIFEFRQRPHPPLS